DESALADDEVDAVVTAPGEEVVVHVCAVAAGALDAVRRLTVVDGAVDSPAGAVADLPVLALLHVESAAFGVVRVHPLDPHAFGEAGTEQAPGAVAEFDGVRERVFERSGPAGD